MYLSPTRVDSQMSTMSPFGGFMAAPMVALQQQFVTMMMGMLSTLFQGGFGGATGASLPSVPHFGGGPAPYGGGGLNDFLGGSSGSGIRSGRSGGQIGQALSQRGGKAMFNVASFNVLGSSHTNAGGNKPGMASGVSRMRGAVATMKSHNIDIAGMQEFQGDQQSAFKRLAPNFGVVAEKDNAIVYNKKKFRLLDKRTVTIPYFEGNPRKMPVVKLQDKATGKQMWVVNVHNPADTKNHPHNARNRAKAIEIEQSLVRKLQGTGLPVIITGDFNDRGSVDGSMDRAGMDSAAPNRARSEIDYIFGSAGVNFSNYSADHRTQSNGTSDHPIIVSTASI